MNATIATSSQRAGFQSNSSFLAYASNIGMMVTTREKAKELSTDPGVEVHVVSYGYHRTKKEFMSIHSAFIEGAQDRGLTNSQAETVWTFLSQFVGYGFNKAHSATYGTIAYQTAFLKYYFPVEYMCAVFNKRLQKEVIKISIININFSFMPL